MCSVMVVCRCGTTERTWLAMRLPLCRISTVVSVMRASTVARISRRHRAVGLVVFEVIAGRAPTLLPFGVAVRLGRKRIERRPVDRFQKLRPALADLARDL